MKQLNKLNSSQRKARLYKKLSTINLRLLFLIIFICFSAYPLLSCSNPANADNTTASTASEEEKQEPYPDLKMTDPAAATDSLQAKTASARTGSKTNMTEDLQNHSANEAHVKLGNEVLLDDYRHLVTHSRVGLITNQTGINSQGESTVHLLAQDPEINLAALYAPEHGLDGKAGAGEYVESYTHEALDIPVFSLYGRTRKPTREMLAEVDVLLYDIQDIGARTYTYISTLNYAMQAGAEHNTPIVVLDRPNPLGGLRVEGPVLEDPFKSFIGVDNLPKAHGMTIGELGRFFNRHIGAELTVVPMENYKRNMIFQDTGLPWVGTSPNIQSLDSAFKYMATGLGEGTGVRQADKFHWIGGKGLDAREFTGKLNRLPLEGVNFIPEAKDGAGGARLEITDYYQFNPAKTGIYTLATAFQLGDFTVPKSGNLENSWEIVMFDKVMGTNTIGQWLEEGLPPEKIAANYGPSLDQFKQQRKAYLIDKYAADFLVKVNDRLISFDAPPFLDENDRLLVPIRAITEAMGAQVDWDGDNRTVTITGNNKRVVFTINEATVNVDGEVQTMDTRPVIKRDRTMLPLRYLGEYFGADVRYDASWQMVHVCQSGH